MVRNLVRKLGGPAVVASWCGKDISGNAVTAWGLRNQIPWKWRAHVKALAAAKGIRLSEREEKAIALGVLSQSPPNDCGRPKISWERR